MSNMVRPSDMSDLLGEFVDRRPVQAVQLVNATVIARVGKWVNENGGSCSWVAAAAPVAQMLGVALQDRLTIHPRIAGQWQEGNLGDWVVRRRDGEFAVMTDEEFRAMFDPVYEGHVEIGDSDGS